MAASTLAEVAHLAGVSLATASRVLNGSARKPGPGISERVRRAADSLGYVPNAQAQCLATSSSGLIGLIVRDITDPYFTAIACGVQDAAREHNRMVLLATAGGTPADERDAVVAFAAHRAEALIIAGSRSRRPEDLADNAGLAAALDRYCQNGGRVGLVGHPAEGASALHGYQVLSVPNEELATQLACELASKHRRDFAIIGGPPGLLTSDDRIRGFQRGLAAAGLPPAGILRSSFDRAGGYEAGLTLAARIKAGRSSIDCGGSPCIFAVTDAMAIGAATALRSEGLRIPRDAFLAGFDDAETLRGFRPALSTVRLPVELIGRLVTLKALAGRDSLDRIPSAIEGQVVLRRSTQTAS